MTVVALIPARGGSKRIPRKNLQLCAGKTLLDWAIDSARDARLVTDVVVSTDDEEIAAHAKARGVHVAMRPAELAGDDAVMEVVVEHARGQWATDFGTSATHAVHHSALWVLVQPTSPERTGRLIDTCIQEARAWPHRRAVTCGAPGKPNGAVYVFPWGAKTIPREAPCVWVPCNVIDVDTPEDLKRASNRMWGWQALAATVPPWWRGAPSAYKALWTRGVSDAIEGRPFDMSLVDPMQINAYQDGWDEGCE